MSSERARELEQRGIEAARAGQKDDARRLLQASLRLEPVNDNAWLWLASVARDKRERLLCLQKVLEINPENETAIKAVQAMGIDPARLIPQRATIDDSLVEDEDDLEALGGIPLPERDAIRRAMADAEALTEPYTTPPTSDVAWTAKTRGRAGEREIVGLRLQIGTAVAVLAATIVGLAVLAINNSPQLQVTLFGASPTPTLPPPTPTFTLTPLPDINPTATPQPLPTELTRTQTPTVNPALDSWPRDRNETPVYQTPEPTRIYLNAENNALATAIAALEQDRNFDDAVQRMRIRQDETIRDFSPFPYYYEALILLRQDQIDQALARLDTAQELIQRTGLDAVVQPEDIPPFQVVLDMGYANVYLEQMRQALEVNNRALAEDLLEQIATRAETAIQTDPTYAEPYLLWAQGESLLGNYDEAIQTLDLARVQNELASSVPVLVTEGDIYLQRGREREAADDLEGARSDYNEAQYLGFLSTYVNPFNDEGHRLRVEATLALGDPALASIYTALYRFYQPTDADALRLLAEARLAEGKPDFALLNYSEALDLQGSNEELADIYVSRARLYSQQRRYDLALADFNAAFELDPSLATRFQRMQAAYNAGELTIAREDAEALIDTGFAQQDQAQFILARIIVDEGDEANYDQALGLLVEVFGDLPGDLQPIASEYQARIFLAQERLGDALNAVERALAVVETGSRRYLRGRIYEAQGERDDAIEDYEWVITWSTVYQYPFADDARQRVEGIRAQIAAEQAAATATSAAATQSVIDATATREVETTGTAAALTQEAIGTFTPTPQPTLTPVIEDTPEVTPEVTPTLTPAVDPTPTREGG